MASNEKIVPEMLMARLGQIVIRWNNLESSMRRLLLTICQDDTPLADILTANMGTASLMESLETVSNESAPREVSSLVPVVW
jgi:hypothetical protein